MHFSRLLILLFSALAWGEAARAPWMLDWQKIDVATRLQDDGTVLVTERWTVRIEGGASQLRIVVHRLVRDDLTPPRELRLGGMLDPDALGNTT